MKNDIEYEKLSGIEITEMPGRKVELAAGDDKDLPAAPAETGDFHCVTV